MTDSTNPDTDNPELSACCQGVVLYLLCEDEACPDTHEFALCEICGADVEEESN